MILLNKAAESVVESDGCVFDSDITADPILAEIAVVPEWKTPAYSLNDAAGGAYGDPLPFPATFTIPDIPGTNQAASLEYNSPDGTVTNKFSVKFTMVQANGGANPDKFAVIPVDWEGSELTVLSSTITPALSGGVGAINPVGQGVEYSLALADQGIEYIAELILSSPIATNGVWVNLSMLEPPSGASGPTQYEVAQVQFIPEREQAIPVRQITTFKSGEINPISNVLYETPGMTLLNGTGELTETQVFTGDCDQFFDPLLGTFGEKMITDGDEFKFIDLGISSLASISIIPQLPNTTLWNISFDNGTTWSNPVSGRRHYGEGTISRDSVSSIWIRRDPSETDGQIEVTWER